MFCIFSLVVFHFSKTLKRQFSKQIDAEFRLSGQKEMGRDNDINNSNLIFINLSNRHNIDKIIKSKKRKIYKP